VSEPPKIVVLGIVTTMPVAGPTWEVVQYLIGLDRLGYDAYYVEAHRRTPRELMRHPTDDGPALAARFLARILNRYGLGERWAYQSATGDRVFGMSEQRLRRLYRDAALIVNLNGGTEPLPEHFATDRLVYVETDPVWLEVALARGDERLRWIVGSHRAFSTYGLNYGSPDCRVPLPDGIDFYRAPPPVLLDVWRPSRKREGRAFTTVGNWRFEEASDAWSKEGQFMKVLDLPTRASQRFELALGRLREDDRGLLERNGWHVRSAREVSHDPEAYRRYIHASRAEFTVVKGEYANFRTGWFSERSACYLASGKPVIMQDTGFGSHLPTGDGLFAFATIDDALAALDAVESNYVHHSRAARDLAREFLDTDVVLPGLLAHFGLRPARRRSRSLTLPR
jgi:hypothetical protein